MAVRLRTGRQFTAHVSHPAIRVVVDIGVDRGGNKETEMRRQVFFTAVATLVVYNWPTPEAKGFCSGLWVAPALVTGK